MVNAPFSAATAKGRENEAAAWKTYNEVCAREFWHEKPENKGRWPLPVRQWCELLVMLRRKYGSYNAFCNAINMVCKVGSKAAHNVHIAECQRAGVDVGSMQGVRDFDPRVIYQAQHRSTMDLVRRDSGVQVKHTEYINMEEARNGHKFTDHTSLPGLQESACWNMENLSGGRRPRSIAALRVRHLRWTVTSVKHSSGNSWLAPSLTYEFVDEKFMDKRGARGVNENFDHFENFERDGSLSSAVYLYALFKARGLFEQEDPLSSLRAGDVISTHAWAQDYFVYCRMEGDVFFDAEPLSTQSISDKTRNILRRMGRTVRGGRAHRHGAYTRPQMMNLLSNSGVGLDPKTEGPILRAAGWSSVHGGATTRTTYESVLLDRHVNCFGLFYGINMEDAVWQARLQDWLGKDVAPAAPIHHRKCRTQLPLIVRLRALHTQRVNDLRRRLNDVGVRLMQEGLYGRTTRVVLAQRECSVHDAWCRVLKHGARGDLGQDMVAQVRSYNDLRREYKSASAQAIDAERHAFVASFLDACDAVGVAVPVRGNGARLASEVVSDHAAIVSIAREYALDVALLPAQINQVVMGEEPSSVFVLHHKWGVYLFRRRGLLGKGSQST